MSQPSDYPDVHSPKEYSYITDENIKFMESAGARVVPIQWDIGNESLVNKLKQINGLYLPGGNADIWTDDTRSEFSDFAKTWHMMVQFVHDENKNGNFFPLWGTCLGFQQIVLQYADDTNFLENFDDKDALHPIINMDERNSQMFKDMDLDALLHIKSTNAMWYWHNYGITKEKFLSNQKISQNFIITGESIDNNGTKFVASFEHKKYPIYAVQFHPELPQFNFQPTKHVSHHPLTIKSSQHFMNFFVNLCRRNNNQFSNQDEENASLIYAFTGQRIDNSSKKCYFFKNFK